MLNPIYISAPPHQPNTLWLSDSGRFFRKKKFAVRDNAKLELTDKPKRKKPMKFNDKATTVSVSQPIKKKPLIIELSNNVVSKQIETAETPETPEKAVVVAKNTTTDSKSTEKSDTKPATKSKNDWLKLAIPIVLIAAAYFIFFRKK